MAGAEAELRFTGAPDDLSVAMKRVVEEHLLPSCTAFGRAISYRPLPGAEMCDISLGHSLHICNVPVSSDTGPDGMASFFLDRAWLALQVARTLYAHSQRSVRDTAVDHDQLRAKPAQQPGRASAVMEQARRGAAVPASPEHHGSDAGWREMTSAGARQQAHGRPVVYHGQLRPRPAQQSEPSGVAMDHARQGTREPASPEQQRADGGRQVANSYGQPTDEPSPMQTAAVASTQTLPAQTLPAQMVQAVAVQVGPAAGVHAAAAYTATTQVAATQVGARSA